MSRINEIYEKINQLEDLIKNEPKNSLKRKVNIKLEIEELEREKQHAGFRHNYALVNQYNTNIKKLKEKLNIDYTKIFKRKIEIYNNEVLGIILDYYKQNLTIDDIIEKEGIEEAIINRWFAISDFGKNTGYLFVENIDNGGNFWQYSNPINEVKFQAQTFDELTCKINENNETLLIFNDEIALLTKARDMQICQHIIDRALWDLDDIDCDYKGIFNNLKHHADKFKSNQLMRLSEFVLNRSNITGCLDSFKYIIDVNKQNLDSEYIEILFQRIIEEKLRYLDVDFNKIGDIIVDLNVFADYFNDSQLKHLSSLVDNAPFYKYSVEFQNILQSSEFS